jgi:hypothetical protein
MRPATALTAVLLAVAPGLPHAQPAQGRWPPSSPYSIELTDEAGSTLPTFEHRGRLYVLGTMGQRYLVRVRNDSGRRAEIVVSVDGRDVIDGRPSAWEKRGYVLDPHGEAVIDGYRLSQESVAAFRFSSVPRSYASRKGDARDVGVIGVAVFQERQVWRRQPPPYPIPYGERRPSEAPAPSAPGARGEAGPQRHAGDALARGERRGDERPGLGTEFAEEHESHVREVGFERASSRPETVLTVRYDDRRGLLAMGVDVDGWRAGLGDTWTRQAAEPFRRDSPFAEPPPGWRTW